MRDKPLTDDELVALEASAWGNEPIALRNHWIMALIAEVRMRRKSMWPLWCLWIGGMCGIFLHAYTSKEPAPHVAVRPECKSPNCTEWRFVIMGEDPRLDWQLRYDGTCMDREGDHAASSSICQVIEAVRRIEERRVTRSAP